jgi:hypothetical protein
MAQQQWPMTIPTRPLAELICMDQILKIYLNSVNFISQIIEKKRLGPSVLTGATFSWKELENNTTLRKKENSIRRRALTGLRRLWQAIHQEFGSWHNPRKTMIAPVPMLWNSSPVDATWV